jgi:aconitase A
VNILHRQRLDAHLVKERRQANVEQVSTEMFRKEYAEVFSGTEEWRAIKVEASDT